MSRVRLAAPTVPRAIGCGPDAHSDWCTSIRWIFKGSGWVVLLKLGSCVGFAAVLVLAVELTGTEAQLDLLTDVTTGLSGCMALLLAFRLVRAARGERTRVPPARLGRWR